MNVKSSRSVRLRRIELHECGHPEPDARGMAGAERIAAIAAAAELGDLLLCLISGGASALACQYWRWRLRSQSDAAVVSGG